MNTKTLKSLIRPVIVFGTGLAAYGVANAAIRSNVDEPENKLQKLSLAVGATTLSMIAGERAAAYVAGMYDATVASANKDPEAPSEIND